MSVDHIGAFRLTRSQSVRTALVLAVVALVFWSPPLPAAAAVTPSTVIGWGSSDVGRLNGTGGLTAISAGSTHSLGLRSDGTVVAWGYDGPEVNVPAGLSGVTAVSAGAGFSLALKNDGTVVGWGDNSDGQVNIPAGLTNVIAISAGFSHALALKSDGTVVSWGNNDYDQRGVPAGLTGVTAISAGGLHSLALKSNGTVVAWGTTLYGQNIVPADAQGSVTAIADGYKHSIALKKDGTVVAWGSNQYGQLNIPAGLSDVVAISTTAASRHNLALKNDGTVVGWGDNADGAINVPAGLKGVKAVSAGGYHSLALYTDTTPPTSTATTTPATPDGTNDWYTSTVTVNLSASDSSGGRGVASLTYSLNGGSPTTVNAAATSITVTAEGTSALRYFATDSSGNTETANTFTVKVDKTPPTITASAVRADGSAYTAGSWTSQNVIVTYRCSDAISGINGRCPASETFDTEGTHTASQTISDLAGNTDSVSFGPILIDKGPPRVTVAPDRASDSNGWYNKPVTFSFTADDGSGAGGGTCTAPVTYSGPDSLTAAVAGSCTDAAGNVGSAEATFRYDATPPVVTYVGNAGTYTVDQTVAIVCHTSDATSGQGLSNCANISGPAYSFGLGVTTVAATTRDEAGNVTNSSTTFTVGVTFDSLCTVSSRFSTSSSVDHGLCDKLATAKAAALAGNVKAKNNALNAYRNQLSAQSGKALTKEQTFQLTILSKGL